jgi:hypothetical protein
MSEVFPHHWAKMLSGLTQNRSILSSSRFMMDHVVYEHAVLDYRCELKAQSPVITSTVVSRMQFHFFSLH